ncbi:MAG TPA: condensation domain-containing protein, partial [Vicinamibacterales bacterium]|nr:condensation domain-containing protein [Vicinamibacterales bacterium]
MKRSNRSATLDSSSSLSIEPTDRPALDVRARPDRVPLSFGQQRLWFIDRLGNASTEYNLPEAVRLLGPLDVDALERTIHTIVARHEVLRTHFSEIDGVPAQVIMPTLRIPLRVDDWRELPSALKHQRVITSLREEADDPFDLTQGPLLRVRLFWLDDDEYIFVRTCHHIVSDGWSQAVFNYELTTVYEAYRNGRPSSLRPLPLQYADFALWQRELHEAAAEEGLAYWKAQLSGIPDRLELPADRPRLAVQTFAGAMCRVTLNAEQTATLKAFGRSQQATLYMTLLSGFAVLLSRYVGQDDCVVGSAVANRSDVRLREMIGFFGNSLVMRTRVRPDARVQELVQQVRRTAIEAYRHQDVPFERIVEELAPARRLDVTPLFQVMFALQSVPAVTLQLAGLAAEPISTFRPSNIGLGPLEAVAAQMLKARFDLEVHWFEDGGQLECFWLYNRDLFDAWRMEQMLRHYVHLLEQMVADPDRAVGSLALLAPEEQRELLATSRGADMAPAEATLVGLL